MPKWKTDDLDTLFIKLWDRGFDLYPSITSPIPGVRMVDPSNEDKEFAYRKGCCDGIEMFTRFLMENGYFGGCERQIVEYYINTIRQNNGL